MKKSKTPSLVTTAIITTITVFTWIAFGIYRALTSLPPVSVPPEILAPLSPELDSEAMSRLTQRLYFEEGQTGPVLIPRAPEEETQPSPSISPPLSPTISITPSATPSATPTP
jgi:hypothetical protein